MIILITVTWYGTTENVLPLVGSNPLTEKQQMMDKNVVDPDVI
jgi:hypothetical protein